MSPLSLSTRRDTDRRTPYCTNGETEASAVKVSLHAIEVTRIEIRFLPHFSSSPNETVCRVQAGPAPHSWGFAIYFRGL